MNTLTDINLEDYKTVTDKLTVNSKISNNQNLTEIKCFKNFEDVSYLEARKINLIKIQKTVFLNLLNLQEIDLRENKLHKISKKFLNFKNLKILRLDDNLISYFPSFLSNLEYLENLSVTNNQIKNIPTSIQNFQNLKIFKFSNNKIELIPIEMGLLKSLETLHMDANYLTQIPTTLCYLKHLSELSLEWLEFTDPPLQKVIKENIGKTIISLIRTSLQEMIKQNILYCDFHNFISRNSIQGASYDTVKNDKVESQSKLPHHSQSYSHNSIKKEPSENTIDLVTTPVAQVKKLMKIFLAIENNYYGVIKSLIYGNDDYLKIKNNDNKTPLYLTIHNNKFELTRLILTKIDFSNIINSYTYLHKAIRMRDAALTEKLIEMGIDVNEIDDQGNFVIIILGSTCFHILFSVFTKNFAKCSLIGDMLLRKSCKLNTLNHENWAPVHVASKRGAKECLQWIINQNKLLKKDVKENFDLNLKGKNKCSPLHISVICFRLEETFLLLEAGCDVFVKNMDGKSPRKVCYGNFLLSKLLRNYENYYLSSRFPSNEIIKETNYYITTVEENIKIDEYDSVTSPNKIEKVFSTNRWQDQYNSLDMNKQQLLHLNYLSSNYNTAKEKLNDEDLAENEIRKKLEKLRTSNSNLNNYKSNQCKREIPKIPRSLASQYETEKIPHSNLNSNNFPINLIPLPRSRKNSKNNNLRNSTSYLEKGKSKSVSKSKSKSIFETHPLKATNKINLHFHKGILLGSDNSLAEKYESLMQLKLISTPDNLGEVEKILELYLKEVDIDLKINSIILCDLCDLIIAKHFSNLKTFLEEILNKTQNIKNYHFLNLQLKNTLQILNFVEQSEYKFYIGTNRNRSDSNKKTKKIRKDSNANLELKRKYKTKSNFMTKPNSIQNKYFSETKMKNIKKKKSIAKNENEDSNDEYNFTEMNENSEGKNDIISYENQMPRRILKELKSNVGLNLSQNNESCNVADSSFSMLKAEKSVDEIKDEYENSESENALNLKNFRVQNDKFKPSDKLFSSIPPKKIDSIFFECDNDFDVKMSLQNQMKTGSQNEEKIS